MRRVHSVVSVWLLVWCSGAAVSAQPTPRGREFQVNTYTRNEQYHAATAMDDDGDFVVVWDSAEQDGSSHGVFAQRYDSSGLRRGPEFQVNTRTVVFQYRPSAAMDSDGDFVVTWSSFGDGDEAGVFAQRFASAGTKIGAEFQVNTNTTYVQSFSSVAMDDDGDFVVAWQDYQDGSGQGVFAQRFGSTGQRLGGEFQVNTVTLDYQGEASVAMDSDGDFVVAWSEWYTDGSYLAVIAQRFDSQGTALGSAFQVNTYTYSFQFQPSVAMNDVGFVIAWASYHDSSEYDGHGVFARRFDSSGAAIGSDFQVNTYTIDRQTSPAAVIDDAGGFVVAWHSYEQDGDRRGVFARSFDSSGVAQTAELQVNSYTTEIQQDVSAAMDADGDFVLAWESIGQDGHSKKDPDNRGVFAQRFSASGAGGPTILVAIDIDPKKLPNKVNVKSNSPLDVAILTTSSASGDAADFDAWDVDSDTVVFGPLEASPHGFAKAVDVDRDGDLDMLLRFKIRASGLSCATTSATLRGETFTGAAVEGTDSVAPNGC